MRNWLMELLRLFSTVRLLHVGNLGKPVVSFQSKAKHPRTRGAVVKIPVQGQGKTDIPVQANTQEAKGLNSSFLQFFVLFRSSTDWMIPTPTRRSSCLLNPLIQMLSSSRNILTGMPDIMFNLCTLWQSPRDT